jgi:flagellar assembly protein FliH
MAYAKLIAFDRVLSGACLPGQSGRQYSETELAARDEAAYRRGLDAARQLADGQMVEFRSDIQRLSEGVFERLSGLDGAVLAQLRDGLPALALDVARRLLAGYEPPPEVVSRICEEALGALFPERDNLELILSAADAELLKQLNPDWVSRYPGLRIRTESTLVRGDCQVRSRFGLIDARRETKLAALGHALNPV